MAIAHFKQFARWKVLFPRLNETFSEEYADFLLFGPRIGRIKRKISRNTAVSYFAKYRATLKEAFKKGLLPVNLGEIISAITPKDTPPGVSV